MNTLGDVMDNFGLQLRKLMANRTSIWPIKDLVEVLQMFQRIFQCAPLKTMFTDQRVSVDPTRVVRHIFCKKISD